MFKKMICIGMLLIMALSFAACVNENGLQSRIEELENKLEQQADRITELESTNKNQADKIAELEEENNRLMEEIEKLEDLLAENGIGMKSGYASSGDPGTGYNCAFKSTKTEFNIDNLELTFSYGLPGTDTALPDTVGKVILYFSNSNDDRYTIKEINLKEFASGKYGIKTVSDRLIFSHSEQLVVPKELFNQEQGIIYFSIITDSADEHFSMRSCSIGFHYKLDGENVLLSRYAFEN